MPAFGLSSSINRTIKKIDKMGEKFEDAYIRLQEDLAEETVELAKQNAVQMDAFDSGRLIDNIHYEKTVNGVRFVSNPVNLDDEAYGPIVHWGLARHGRNAKPRPYLQNAFNWFRVQVLEKMGSVIRKSVK